MPFITRRGTISLGAISLGGVSLGAGLPAASARAAVTVADVPALDLKPEAGAKLRVLRPAKFVDADETIFTSNSVSMIRNRPSSTRGSVKYWRTSSSLNA